MTLDSQQAVDLARQAITLMLLIGGPLLAVSLVVGLVLSVFQTLTQVQEQSLSTIPRMIATAVAVIVLLPWITAQLVEYTTELIGQIPHRY